LSDIVDLLPSKAAAQTIDEFGLELLEDLDAKQAFHGLLAGSVIFGIKHLGPQPTAAWLRMLADQVERRATVN
jgi:hypothetical protein